MLVRYAAAHTPHVPKAFEQMNVKLAEVVPAITGAIGLRSSAAILAGERCGRKPNELAFDAGPLFQALGANLPRSRGSTSGRRW
jgi:hypothetical protein